jgi:gamma-glutamyl hydrolase
LWCVFAAGAADTLQPTIGILTVPTQKQCVDEPQATGSFLGPLSADYQCFIPSGYVKLVGMGQARAVLLPCRVGERFDQLMRSVNGFLFTGMYTDYQCRHAAPGVLTAYGEAGRRVIEHVINENRRGVHLPLHAECKGFNMLAFVISGVDKWTSLIRDDIASLDEPAPIAWNPAIDPAAASRVYRAARAYNASELLTRGKNLMNRHPYGLLPGNFSRNRNLTEFFGPFLATTTDLRGVDYVSLAEAAAFPIVGVATHPEKVLFEWRADIVYPRGPDAVRANIFWGPMLANEARRNDRTFEDLALEASSLAFNTTANPLYDSAHLMGGEFRQLYFTVRNGDPGPQLGNGRAAVSPEAAAALIAVAATLVLQAVALAVHRRVRAANSGRRSPSSALLSASSELPTLNINPGVDTQQQQQQQQQQCEQ